MSTNTILKRSDSFSNDPTYKSTHDFEFVGGTFSTKHAKTRLLRFINDQLIYHSVRSLGSQERLGRPDIESEKKIEELTQYKEESLALIEYAEKNGLNIALEAKIKLNLL